MNPDPSRIVKPKSPAWLYISSIVGGLLLLAGIFFAIAIMQRGIVDARMSGTITAKNFTPQPQQQITIGDAGLRTDSVAGNFTLTVSVPQRSGPPREFTVWVPEAMFNQVNVGDPFDVGPYLVPSQN